VFLTSELFEAEIGAWAITPIFKHIKKSIIKSEKIKWLVICEELTRVNVSLLVHNLGKEDASLDQFLGSPLFDKEATIIHHFAFFKDPTKFLYPYIRAGIALTIPFIER
jgi:UDP-glucose:O-linked fucose beta-1,3-glucosyltransferase